MLDTTGIAGRGRRVLREYLLSRPQILAILPCLMLTAYWTFGEAALLVTSIAVPGIFAAAGALGVSPETLASGRDPVTGLPGPETGTDAVDRSIARNPSGALTTAVIAMEIDNFAVLMDQHGPGASDRILKLVAERLTSNIRAADLLIRLDGPAFALFLQLRGRQDLDALLDLAERLQAAFETAISLDGRRVYLSLSIGICPPARSPGRSGADVLDGARIALDQARQAGAGGIRVYAGSMDRFRSPREDLVADLSAAFDHGEIRFSFQPQIAADDGALTGIEMLVRWHHKRHGVLPPSDFLEEIRHLGLSKGLEDLCLRDGLAAVSDWLTAGLEVPFVTINLPMEALEDPEFSDRVRWHLDQVDLPGQRLGFDIEASTDQLAQDENVVRNIRLLKTFGVHMTLDDFGGARLSVETAQGLGFSRAKISRGRVTRLDRDQAQHALAEGLILLSQSLGLAVVAVGVETPGEAAALAALGCGSIQGYHVAAPMTLEDMTGWIADRSGRPARTSDPDDNRQTDALPGKTA